MNKDDNITCDICKKIRWSFVQVITEKRDIFARDFKVCTNCFKNKDIEEIIRKIMEKRSKDLIEEHQRKIDEIKKKLKEVGR